MTESLRIFNPKIIFIYFIIIIVCSVMFITPLFSIVSFICAAIIIILMNKFKGCFLILKLSAFLLLISVINPLFNQRGNTVIFSYFDRVFTLEALFYGITMAFMCCAVILWFNIFNEVINSEKITYITGQKAPALTLIFIMSMRFIPLFKKRIKSVTAGRKYLGNKNGLTESINVLNAFSAWALEASNISSDSMNARGYGAKGKKTYYQKYHFRHKDILNLMLYLCSSIIIIFCNFNGAFSITYYPNIQIEINNYTYWGMAAFIFTALLPVFSFTLEEIRWHSLKLKI